MKKIFISLIFISIVFAQSGFIKTPDQLYRSIDNKKPTGEELFGKNKLPDKVDLSSKFPQPGYQGAIGSCAAWAVGYACKTYQETIERHLDPQITASQFSPSFIYNMVNKGENKGSTFPEVFNLVKELGCATMSTMPYTTDYLLKPNTKAIKEAENYKIQDYKRLQNGPGLIPAMKASLAKGQAVIIALRVYENFRKLKNEIYDEISGPQTGGHGMCLVGYDDHNKTFKLINSWGKKWGENGYCRISYDLVDKLFMEAYVCEDIVESKEVEFAISAPRELRASEGAFENLIELSWEKVKGADEYEVYRSNNKKEELEKLETVLLNGYRDTEVLDKVKYIYAVKAIGKGQTSGFSEIACGWASKEELGIPGNLTAEKFEDAILLTWMKVNKVEHYNIYRMKENEEKYKLLGQSKDESFTDYEMPKNFLDDIRIYYLITAQREEEESSYSNMVTIKLYSSKSKKIIPDLKKDIAKKILPPKSEDIIIPKTERKELKKSKEQVDFYDADYMEKFFEAARKAEEEAYRRIQEKEDKYFDKFRQEEEKYKNSH